MCVSDQPWRTLRTLREIPTAGRNSSRPPSTGVSRYPRRSSRGIRSPVGRSPSDGTRKAARPTPRGKSATPTRIVRRSSVVVIDAGCGVAFKSVSETTGAIAQIDEEQPRERAGQHEGHEDLVRALDTPEQEAARPAERGRQQRAGEPRDEPDDGDEDRHAQTLPMGSGRGPSTALARRIADPRQGGRLTNVPPSSGEHRSRKRRRRVALSRRARGRGTRLVCARRPGPLAQPGRADGARLLPRPGLVGPRPRRPPRDLAGRGGDPDGADRGRHLRGPRRRHRRRSTPSSSRRCRASRGRSSGPRPMPVGR